MEDNQQRTSVSALSPVEGGHNDSSCDGFEVNDEFQLDEADPEVKVNLDQVMSLPKQPDSKEEDAEEEKENVESSSSSSGSRSRNSSNSDQEKSSPFAISSLLHSKVLLEKNTDSPSVNDNNGCSPSLPSTSASRQERRRLDFSGMEARPGPSSNAGNLYKRSHSMSAKPLSLNKVNSSPDLCNKQIKTLTASDQDTSPVSSRPFSNFKRPKAPLGPRDQNVEHNAHSDTGHPSKKVKRFSSAQNLSNLQKGEDLDSPQSQIAKPLTNLHLSEKNDANIKKALDATDEPNLTGDRTRQLVLPTVPGTAGKGKNLLNITCDTLADLLRDEYKDKVASYRIIDARYEYEYEGGHIRGAENFGLWDENAFLDAFFPESKPPRESPPDKDAKADILIFHCEFSSARGPSIMQMLRQQ